MRGKDNLLPLPRALVVEVIETGLADADEVQALPAGLGATALVARLDAAMAAILKNWPL